MSRVTRSGAVWDFVVGDDWRIAAGVIVALAVTAVVAGAGRRAWWILPLATAGCSALSVWRAAVCAADRAAGLMPGVTRRRRPALALVVLAATLAVAAGCARRVSRRPCAAALGAVLLVAVGAIACRRRGAALRALGPTVGFLAALLLIAEGCRREGLFDAIGDVDGPPRPRVAPAPAGAGVRSPRPR